MSHELIAIEEQNRERIAAWWERIGQEPEYPTSTATVAALLSAVDYVCNPDIIVRAITEEWIRSPAKSGGRHHWQASDIVTLASALEYRRMWEPFSQIHGHKLTQIEKLQQVLTYRGEETFTDLAQYDYEGLLGMLHSVAHDVGAVQVMTEAIRHKLKLTGVL